MRKHGNLDFKKLLSLKKVFNIQISPDKKKLGYISDKSGKFGFYVRNLEDNTESQVAGTEVVSNMMFNYKWINSDLIAFNKDNKGNEQHDIFTLDLNTRDIKQLTDTPHATEIISDISADGKWILFSSTANGQMNVHRLSLINNEIEQVTVHERPAFAGKFSPDGTSISYGTNEDDDFNNSDIYLARFDGSEVEKIIQVKAGSKDSFVDWSKNGKMVLFSTDGKGANQAGLYNLESKEITLFGKAETEEIPIGFTTDNKNIIVLQNRNSAINPSLYNIETGEKIEIGQNIPDCFIPQIYPGFGGGLQFWDEKTILLTLTTPTRPIHVRTLNIESGESEIFMAPDFGEFSKDDFVTCEHVWYKSTDGLEIPALVYKPKDYSTDKEYQAIIIPHGGPTGQYFFQFYATAQLFTDLGLIVLLPNFRGSTGYGDKFMRMNIKDIGGMDMEDWVAGIDFLVDNYNVRKNGIAIYGISYGGYATYLSIGKKPDLWKSACSWVGITHWGQLYDSSMPHFKHYIHQLFGDMKDESIRELIEDRSPLNYVNQVKTPLLILHGTNDPRCPIDQARIYKNELLKHGKIEGKDFEYVEFGDEGHTGFGDSESETRAFTLILDFFYRTMNT